MKRLILILIALLLLAGCACHPADSDTADKLELYAFSVGKADALLIRTSDAAVMIDTGENGDGDELVEALRALGVEKLDLLILTHFDKDHIGGADALIRSLPIARIIMPAYEKESKQRTELLEEIDAANVPVTRQTEDETMSFGAMDLSVWVSPVAFDGKSDNEQSLITKILYGGKTLLFMGDAEKDELKALVFSGKNLTCDILKLPHHGVYDANLFELLAVALPQYVVICDSAKNPAEEKTMQTLDLFEPVILQTKNGDVHVTVAEGTITVNE